MKNFKIRTRDNRWENAFRWANYGFSVFLVVGILNAMNFAYTREISDLAQVFESVFMGLKLGFICFLFGWYRALDLIQYKDYRCVSYY